MENITTHTRKVNHRLPIEVTDAVDTLSKTLTPADFREMRLAYATVLRNAGWTLQSIGNLFGWSRERVRQVAIMDLPKADAVCARYRLSIPDIPLKEVKVRVRREYIEPSPETLARLLELKPMAMAVRSHSKAFRAEAEEYTRLVNHAHEVEGVTLYRLAKRLGVTHGALRFRLARYGYKMPKTGESKVYKPVLDKNRAR